MATHRVLIPIGGSVVETDIEGSDPGYYAPLARYLVAAPIAGSRAGRPVIYPSSWVRWVLAKGPAVVPYAEERLGRWYRDGGAPDRDIVDRVRHIFTGEVPRGYEAVRVTSPVRKLAGMVIHPFTGHRAGLCEACDAFADGRVRSAIRMSGCPERLAAELLDALDDAELTGLRRVATTTISASRLDSLYLRTTGRDLRRDAEGTEATAVA